MELTQSFLDLLPDFAPIFTSPSFITFIEILTGWILSHRHRYITEIIFAGGNVDNGHWSRFHRFFSHAVWDIDALAARLAYLVVRVFTLDGTLLWAVDDTLCRKRGLTLYGVMVEAARRRNVEPDRISFVDAQRWLLSARPGDDLVPLIVNPDRPGRVQPRVRKRRPKKYPLMQEPRSELRKRLLSKSCGLG